MSGEESYLIPNGSTVSLVALSSEGLWDFSRWYREIDEELQEVSTTTALEWATEEDTAVLARYIGEFHSADYLHEELEETPNEIELAELLRIIQFFNLGGFQCSLEETDDGYAAGGGENKDSELHDSDYQQFKSDWKIGLSEALRLIQFFNVGALHRCPNEGTPDGFCAGLES